MKEVLEFFNANGNAVTAIGIILTFAVSTVSLYFSVKNNRAVHYVNAVTKNRVEWMYKLRDLCADYIAAVSIDGNYFVIVIKDKDTEKIGDQLSTIRKLCSQIKLMLNFADEMDKNIIEIVEQLKKRYEGYYAKYGTSHPDELKDEDGQKADKMRDETNAELKALDRLLQIYLKAEWNRVKYESRGKIYEKETQAFDIKELKLKYDNPGYKNNKWKRFCINTKAKIKRILGSPGFAVLALCIGITVLIIFAPEVIIQYYRLCSKLGGT